MKSKHLIPAIFAGFLFLSSCGSKPEIKSAEPPQKKDERMTRTECIKELVAMGVSRKEAEEAADSALKRGNIIMDPPTDEK